MHERNGKQQEMTEYRNKENCKLTTWKERELYDSEGDEFMASGNSIDKNKISHLDFSSVTKQMIPDDQDDMVNKVDAVTGIEVSKQKVIRKSK